MYYPDTIGQYALMILARVVVLFVSLTIHECAHGFVALKLGDPTAKRQGRLTLNPIKHLSLWGTFSMILTGVGWAKPVPVNPYYFKNKKVGMALVAIAGPIANFLLAFLTMILFQVCGYMYIATAAPVWDALNFMFQMMTISNIWLTVFNLLPIPPLDGSRVLGLFLPEKIYFKIMSYERYIMIGLLVFIYFGILDTPLNFIRDVGINVLTFLTSWVGPLMQSILGLTTGTPL